MKWVCLEDRAPLELRDEAWTCSGCGRRYKSDEGVPCFGSEAPTAAKLDALWRAMDGQTAEQALTRFCREHDCSRSPYSADWKFFFSVPAGGTTLELGGGVGDDSADLAPSNGRTVSIVPNRTNARILSRRLRQQGHDWPLAVLQDLTRLPLEDRSVQAVALEDAAAPAFGLSNANIAAAAAEWRRVLAPGGTVFLGLANGLHRLPGLRAMRAALRARPHPDTLNRRVKRWGAPAARRRLRVGSTVRAMLNSGFGAPIVYAPLPDENDTQVVIPARDDQVVRYFLDNLVRKNSTAVRVALRVAHWTVRAGLFHRLVPYYYLIFKCES